MEWREYHFRGDGSDGKSVTGSVRAPAQPATGRGADPVIGGDAVAAWIGEAIAPVIWQHHLLSVYHVEVDGDDAKALVYHTSHQVFEDEPDSAKVLVGRYHNELRREADNSKSRLVLELLWAEAKIDAAGYFALVGGRGPID